MSNDADSQVPVPAGTHSDTTATQPVEAPAPAVSYSTFVSKFLSTCDREKYPSPKERLKLAATAWNTQDKSKRLYAVRRRRTARSPTAHVNHPTDDAPIKSPNAGHASDTVSTSVKKSGAVSKLRPVKRLSELSSFLTPRSEELAAITTGTVGRRSKFVIPRTKANQRALTAAARKFQRDVADGRLMTASEAYLEGVNAWTQLCS